MRQGLIWLGIIVVVVGVFLPWAKASSSFGSSTANGFDFGQAILNLVIGGVGIFVSFIAGANGVSARISGLVLLLAGGIVGFMGYDALQEISRGNQTLSHDLFQWHREVMNVRMKAAPGVYVTVAGGILLGLAGLGYLLGGEDE